MPISVLTQPDRWSSAYRPTEFTFRSDRSPNTTAGDTGVPILQIEQSVLGVFARISSQFATGDLVAGETILIEGTDSGLYDGLYRIRDAFESSGALIAYLDTAYVGDDSGGVASRTYTNFRIAGTVTFDGTGNIVPFELDKDPLTNTFTLNVQDMAARQFRRIFDSVPADLAFGTVQAGVRSIAMGYDVRVWERYTVFEDGLPSTFDDDKDTEVRIRGLRTVNMIHPYHKDDIFDMDWDTDIGSVFPIGLGQGQRKILSWGSRTLQEVSDGEDFFISFLINGANETGLLLSVTSYVDATPITVQGFSLAALPLYAGTINVGPSVLTILTAGITHYTVRITDPLGNDLMESMSIKYNPKCEEVNRRMYWRNKLGGLDQYTMRGRETNVPNVARQSISRQYNPLPGTSTYYGGWNERGTRVEVQRTKILTGELASVDTLTWLSEDCFESHDHATIVREGWWTPMVITTAQGTPYGTDNQNARFLLEYHYGVDNQSQRG